MAAHVLSLDEITTLEAARILGAPAFPTVLRALAARWRLPLRDSETAVRLLFYIHEASTTQPQYTGISASELPNAEDVLAEAGGESALPADAVFGLALLLNWEAWPFGDEITWSATARRWAQAAAEREPESKLFREWRYFMGDVPSTEAPKIYILPEVHARYHGRGAFGARMVELLTSTLQHSTSKLAIPPSGAA